jgi:hypothetical protein
MKALLIVFALFSVQYVRSQTTYTYPFESHFIDDKKSERKWITRSHTVTVKKKEIIISDESNDYVYTITKESIPKPEKGYTVYEVIKNGKKLMIMRPADFSYFMVMESKDKPVWVLSDSKF